MKSAQYLTLADIATELSVSLTTARKIARRCGYIRVGRCVRVPRVSLDLWLQANTVEALDTRSSSRRRARPDGGPTSLIRPGAKRCGNLPGTRTNGLPISGTSNVSELRPLSKANPSRPSTMPLNEDDESANRLAERRARCIA